jgi:fucose permease
VTHASDLPATRRERAVILIAAALALTALGAVQAMYGPAFPSLMQRFGVGLDRVGDTVVLHFLGGLASTVASTIALQRFGYRRTLVVAGTAAASGMLIAAVTPVWSLLLVGATLGGFGFGLLNIVINLLVTRVFASRAAPYLNFLSALFGIGAILGPAAVAAIAAAGVNLTPLFFALAGAVGLATAVASRAPDPPVQTRDANVKTPWGLATGFALVFLFYVGAETSVASWETVHLEPYVGASRAAALTSLFWVMLTVGRFVAVPISLRVRPRYVVLTASILSLVALSLTHISGLAPVAYAAAGFLMAPIFPTTLAWIAAVFPSRSERVIPYTFAIGTFGPIASTATIGAWAAAAGTDVIPTALTLLVGVLVVINIGMLIATRER